MSEFFRKPLQVYSSPVSTRAVKKKHEKNRTYRNASWRVGDHKKRVELLWPKLSKAKKLEDVQSPHPQPYTMW